MAQLEYHRRGQTWSQFSPESVGRSHVLCGVSVRAPPRSTQKQPRLNTLHQGHVKDGYGIHGFPYRHIRHMLWPTFPRVFLWALVMGPFDSGGVCSMGPCFVYSVYSAYIGVQIRGPY